MSVAHGPLTSGQPIGVATLSFHVKGPDWYTLPISFGIGRGHDIENILVKSRASEILDWWAGYDLPDLDVSSGAYRLRVEKVKP